jgi:hypothetical protein
MAKAFFRDLPVVIHQAPFKLNAPKAPIEVPRSFAHILHNTGFADGDELESLVAAWLQLFKAVKPDLLVFDHSPSGLLASLLLDVPRITLGSGFFTPPDVFPLPDLRPWLPPIPEELERDELAVHEVLSRVLDKHGGPSLPRVASLYRHAINYLTTFPELDNYGIRTEDTYIGVWSLPGGEEPQWPDAPGKRIFAYLRPFPALPNLLSLLEELQVCGLLYVEGLPSALRRRYTSQQLRFVDRRQDIATVAQQCDLVISHGNAGITSSVLWYGLPNFLIPTQLEQATNAHQLAQLGVGLGAEEDQPERIAARVMAMLHKKAFHSRCRAFREKYIDWSPLWCISQLANFLDQLLA